MYKMRDARAKLLFCLSNVLLFAVLVVVDVLINSGKISLFGFDVKSQFKMQFIVDNIKVSTY